MLDVNGMPISRVAIGTRVRPGFYYGLSNARITNGELGIEEIATIDLVWEVHNNLLFTHEHLARYYSDVVGARSAAWILARELKGLRSLRKA
jgi:hypothetical protein